MGIGQMLTPLCVIYIQEKVYNFENVIFVYIFMFVYRLNLVLGV